MGEKKKKEAAQKTWKKVIFIIAAVLFVVVMVVSSMGSSWITGLSPIRPGDTVVIDYTLYDASGNPFMTSSQQLYKQQIDSGYGIIYTKQLSLTANQSLKKVMYPVQGYVSTNGGGWEEFALYNSEYNAISNGVVGMRTNEQKRVDLSSGNSMSALFSPEELAAVNMNMSALKIGDSIALGVSDNPNATISNTSAVSYVRLGQVTRKSSSGAVVDFGYPYADISIYSFVSR